MDGYFFAGYQDTLLLVLSGSLRFQLCISIDLFQKRRFLPQCWDYYHGNHFEVRLCCIIGTARHFYVPT